MESKGTEKKNTEVEQERLPAKPNLLQKKRNKGKAHTLKHRASTQLKRKLAQLKQNKRRGPLSEKSASVTRPFRKRNFNSSEMH